MQLLVALMLQVEVTRVLGPEQVLEQRKRQAIRDGRFISLDDDSDNDQQQEGDRNHGENIHSLLCTVMSMPPLLSFPMC